MQQRSHLAVGAAMVTLGLSMIVKNGGDDLRKCLASACDVVDQIVIADTGSTDGTSSIAREFGSMVVTFPWIDDFAAARNAALRPITTDWVLVLDADEDLDFTAKQQLPSLLSGTATGGYVLPIRNYLPVRFACMHDSISQPNDGRNTRAQSCPSFTMHTNCRLFRRHPAIYFVGRVHERVEETVSTLGLGISRADVLIHHFGQLAPEAVRLHKFEYYRELGQAKVKEQPDSAMAWMELGLQEYEAFQNREEALRCFERCLRLDPKRTDAWTYVAMVHSDLGNYGETLRALKNAGNGESGVVMREQLRGDALHNLGQLQEARDAYRRALKSDRNNPPLESKLGYTELRLGMKQQGLGRMLRAVSSAPELPELQDRLLKAYLAVENILQAAGVAEEMAINFPSPRTYLRAASIRAHLKEWSKAHALLECGLREFPGSLELTSACEQAKQFASSEEHYSNKSG
jgi:tetratricopeptide (TPR) repeat protein